MIRLLLLSILVTACGNSPEYDYVQEAVVIDKYNQGEKSTTAGNLITTAIKETYDLDLVLYPTVLIKDEAAIFEKENSNIDELVKVFPDGEKDKFIIGTMRGSDLKEFIRNRSLERFNLEFEVAGIQYEIIFKGGRIVSETYTRERGAILEDDEFYSLAISKHFIFSSDTFPSYKYRNSIDRVFIDSNKIISAKTALREYMATKPALPFLKLRRAQVKHTKTQDKGMKTIAEIQGQSHISPYWGDIVTTQGIITSVAIADTYPGGQYAYLQSETPDKHPETSDAIKIYFPEAVDIKVGDLVELTGTVFEEMNHVENGLTSTALRNIINFKVKDTNKKLPEAVRIGEGFREIPEGHLSTYHGDLNLRPSLNLKDGLDFWESLEGMRVTLSNPKIVGFRGGKEQSDDPKRHLTLFLLPDGNRRRALNSRGGGIMASPEEELFNPQIIPLASGPLTTKDLNINARYKMGEIIQGELTGQITFGKNLFGDGEYLFVLPQSQESIKNLNERMQSRVFTQLEDRPSIQFDSNKLSIAAYNVKNLSPVNKRRIKDTAKMIKTNLNCPDVLGLVEIQDNNGEEFSGSSEANNTLDLLIEATDCGFNYKEANIDPLVHREGGVMGGNIRTALIFNPERLSFVENPLPGPEAETSIMSNGSLSFNPARIFPQSEAFRNTRKSIITEFLYQGRKLFVVVNHFNSKLSDTSHFSSVWPAVYPSERKRSQMANAVNRFVARLDKQNPESLIAVIGDFNEFVNMPAMKILEGNTLYNLIRDLPRNERYTTNHNGNAQPLDYIFVNRNLRKLKKDFKILHLNSDYMGRLSDHDPLISVFNL